MDKAAELLQQNSSYILLALLIGVSGFCAGLLFSRRSHKESTNFWMSHVIGAVRASSEAQRSFQFAGPMPTFTSADAAAALRKFLQEVLKRLAEAPPETPVDHAHPLFKELMGLVEKAFDGAKLNEVKAKINAAKTIGQAIPVLKWVLEQLH